MAKSNTILRWEFMVKFGMLCVYAHLKNIKFIPYSFIRTAKQQAALYAKGRDADGNIVGKVITYRDGYKKKSMHQYCRAIDIVLINSESETIWEFIEDYETLGEFWESLGEKCIWGGRWQSPQDPYHFQL